MSILHSLDGGKNFWRSNINVEEKAAVVVLDQPCMGGRVCLARGESHLETWSVGVRSNCCIIREQAREEREKAVQVMLLDKIT